MGRLSALGAVVCAFALATAAPAGARDRGTVVWVSVTGTASATWHGDPERGCADAGLCGYRGALTIRPRPGEAFGLAYPGEALTDNNTFGTDGVVRVRRQEADGTTSGCVDAAPGLGQAALRFKRVGVRRLRAKLVAGGSVGSRCAGPPQVSRPLRRLPSRTFTVPRVGAASKTLDLSDVIPYAAGRFSGTVTSALKVHVRSARPPDYPHDEEFDPGTDAAPAPLPPLRRFVGLRERYRVVGLTGQAAVTFAAAPEPLCVTLDACGLAGKSTWSIAAARGFIEVDGSAPASRSDRGLSGAVAAIRRDRARNAYIYGDLAGAANGTTVADVTRPDGASCHDTAAAKPPSIVGVAGSRRLRFLIGNANDDQPALAGDLFRTGCPGPTTAEIVGSKDLATGTVPSGWLARRRFAVDLNGGGRFSGAGFGGTRSAHLSLRLRRVFAHVTYSRRRSDG